MTAEDFTARKLAANKALLDAIGQIDPSDEDAVQKYEAISKLYHELNADIKNDFDREAKTEELKVEREKIASEANTKAEAIKAERERNESEVKSDTRKAVLDLIGKGGIAAATIFSAVAQIKMFERSTEFEKENALLTTSGQTVVKNGLSGRFFKH